MFEVFNSGRSSCSAGNNQSNRKDTTDDDEVHCSMVRSKLKIEMWGLGSYYVTWKVLNFFFKVGSNYVLNFAILSDLF